MEKIKVYTVTLNKINMALGINYLLEKPLEEVIATPV
jgi:hypothetical protein